MVDALATGFSIAKLLGFLWRRITLRSGLKVRFTLPVGNDHHVQLQRGDYISCDVVVENGQYRYAILSPPSLQGYPHVGITFDLVDVKQFETEISPTSTIQLAPWEATMITARYQAVKRNKGIEAAQFSIFDHVKGKNFKSPVFSMRIEDDTPAKRAK